MCSIIRCQKDASRLQLTGLAAQPTSCMIGWLKKPSIPDTYHHLWLVDWLIVVDDIAHVCSHTSCRGSKNSRRPILTDFKAKTWRLFFLQSKFSPDCSRTPKASGHGCESIPDAIFYSSNAEHRVWQSYRAEVESSRTSLASRTSSRTHFEVLGLGLGLEGQVLGLGLGLEALGPRKLPCPRLEDSTIFEPLKFCWKRQKPRRKFVNTFFYFAQLERRLSQAGLPPNWNFINDKNVTKKPIVSSVSVSF